MRSEPLEMLCRSPAGEAMSRACGGGLRCISAAIQIAHRVDGAQLHHRIVAAQCCRGISGRRSYEESAALLRRRNLARVLARLRFDISLIHLDTP